MNIFFDNCVSIHLAKAFKALLTPDGHFVQHLQERFAPERYPDGVDDLEWIQSLGAEQDWLAISRDARIVTNPHERRALLEAKLVVFVLATGWRHQRRWPVTWGLMRWWERIEREAAKAPPGGAVYQLPFAYSEKKDSIKRLL